MKLRAFIRRLMLGKPIENGIRGTAYVHSRTRAPEPTPKYIGGARLNLLVDVPGHATYKVRHKCTAPGDRYPHPGAVVPVTVSREDPQRLRIDWEQIPTPDELFDRLP